MEYIKQVLPKREIIRVCNMFTIAYNNSILVWSDAFLLLPVNISSMLTNELRCIVLPDCNLEIPKYDIDSTRFVELEVYAV